MRVLVDEGVSFYRTVLKWGVRNKGFLIFIRFYIVSGVHMVFPKMEIISNSGKKGPLFPKGGEMFLNWAEKPYI